MPRAAVLRTALLAALVGLLCLTPAVAMARPPVSTTSTATHHHGWTTSTDTHGTARGRAGTAPTLQRTEPRLEHQLQPVTAAVPRAAVSPHHAGTFVGRSASPVTRHLPRAATCPQMRAPPA